MDDYDTNFDVKKFPTSLQGDVATQFQLAKTLLLFCADRATDFGLKTDVHSKFGTRAQALRQLIFHSSPSNLSHHCEETKLTV
jgi:hypothetical protein